MQTQSNIFPLKSCKQIGVALGLATIGIAGCAAPSAGPPPQVVTLPYPSNQMTDPVKPLPDAPLPSDLAPGFDDVAIIHQQLPESPAFVQAYNHVGKPRIMVFVNRTLTGELMPVTTNDPLATVQNTQTINGAVKIHSTDDLSHNGDYYSYIRNSNRSFESNGPVTYSSRTDIYLQPGQYDETQARSIDYELIENLIADNLSADGKITLISPTTARQKLTDQEVQELQSGRPQMLGELAEKLQADVLVQVTARPSHQTDQGLGIRLVAQAFNTRGGQLLASAAMDVPPPLIKTTLNRYTRFTVRKLMDGMTQSWITMASDAAEPAPVVKPRDTLPTAPVAPAPIPAPAPVQPAAPSPAAASPSPTPMPTTAAPSPPSATTAPATPPGNQMDPP